MTAREKELERLLRETVDYFSGSPMPTPVRAARAFLASSPTQEGKRYTLQEVEAAHGVACECNGCYARAFSFRTALEEAARVARNGLPRNGLLRLDIADELERRLRREIAAEIESLKSKPDET